MATKKSVHTVAQMDAVLGMATGLDTSATDTQKSNMKGALGVTELERKVSGKEATETDVTSYGDVTGVGYYLKAGHSIGDVFNGTPDATVSGKYSKSAIDISGYDEIVVCADGKTEGGARAVIATDEENKIVYMGSWSAPDEIDGNTKKIVINSSAKYLYVSFAVTQTNTKVLAMTSSSDGLEQAVEKIKLNVIYEPDGFDFSDSEVHGLITRTKNGINCNYDITAHAPSGTTYYASPSGDDSNSGTSADAPITLATALKKSDADVVILADGWYDDFSQTLTRAVSMIAADGAFPVVCGGKSYSDWVQVSGNVYKIAKISGFEKTESSTAGQYSSVPYIIDNSLKDDNGDYVRYAEASSLTELENTEGSVFYDDEYIYIHSFSATDVTTNIKVVLSADVLTVNSSYDVMYIQGITFIGGGANGTFVYCHSGSGTVKPMLYAYKCVFDGCVGNNALTIKSADSVLVECKAIRALRDGFNYHLTNTLICESVEIGCKGYNNGYGLQNNNNGSTTHDGNKIIRVNGKYFGNTGPNIADAGEGTQSWNLGCVSHNCTLTNEYMCGNVVIGDGVANMWIDTCALYSSAKDIICRNGSTLYIHNCFANSYWLGDTSISWSVPSGHIEMY